MCVEERLRGLGALGSWVVFTGEEKENGCVVGRLKFFFPSLFFFLFTFFLPSPRWEGNLAKSLALFFGVRRRTITGRESRAIFYCTAKCVA